METPKLVKTVWLHFVQFYPHAELAQLRKGVRETLDFDRFIMMHPDCVWSLLTSSNSFNVTSSYLLDAFVILYSDEGSNKCTKEEAIVFYWYDYVSECQGMYVIVI